MRDQRSAHSPPPEAAGRSEARTDGNAAGAPVPAGTGRRGVFAFLLTVLFALSSQPALAQEEPSLSIGDASVDEADRNTEIATMTFTVTLSQASAGKVKVTYWTSDGSATHGTPPSIGGTGDYRGKQGILTFDPGDRSETIRITVYGDNVDEPDETFTVALSEASGATIGNGTATGTIRDADDTPTAKLILTPDRIGEGPAVSAR